MTRCLAALAAVALALEIAGAQHAAHRLPPIALSLLEQPPTLHAGIGRVHDRVATRSREAQAFYDQGLAHLHSYAWIDAARAFNAALAQDDEFAAARAALSVALEELNRPAEARQALAAAQARLASLPDHDRRHVDVRALQFAAASAPADTTARDAWRQALDAAVAAYPHDVEFLLQRGVAAAGDAADRGQGSGAASTSDYERALSIEPGHFAAHHYLTHALENTGRHAEALSHAAAYAAAAPEAPHARHMHGHNLRRAGRTHDAVAAFEAADRLHRAHAARAGVPLEYEWHVAHNLSLLGASLQALGQMTRAATALEAAFGMPTDLLVQAYNKREWPMFLRGRGKLPEAEAAARTLIAHPHPVVQAAGHIESGFVMLAANRWGDAGHASNAALRLLRSALGGGVAAPALLALQGEFHLRTAAREKGRATLDEAMRRLRAAPGPDAWSQALFMLEGMARAARAVGDWEFADRVADALVDHDPSYAGGYYAQGLVAERKGDLTAARAAFTRARDLWAHADADLPELADLRRTLR